MWSQLTLGSQGEAEPLSLSNLSIGIALAAVYES